MDGVLLSFSVGATLLGAGIFVYLKTVRSRMRRFVLRFEEIMSKVD